MNKEATNPYPKWKQDSCPHCKDGLAMARGIFKLDSKPMHWIVMGFSASACTAPTASRYIEQQEVLIAWLRNEIHEWEESDSAGPAFTEIIDEQKAEIDKLEAENLRLTKQLAVIKLTLAVSVERATELERMVSSALRNLGGALI